MENINFKSNLLIKLFGSSQITIDELQNIDDLILDGEEIVFTEEEFEKIKSDLVYIFAEIQENAREISIINCPDFLRDYIIKHAPTEEIYFEGYEDYFDALKENKIDISDELRNFFAGDSEITEYELYQYIKTSKYLELRPVITLRDYDIIRKYADISDFRIKVENEQDYLELSKIVCDKDLEILIGKDALQAIIDSEQEIPKNLNCILDIQDMSKLSSQELTYFSNKTNIQSIHISSVSNDNFENKDCYTIEEYDTLKDKIDAILNQIDNTKPDIVRFMQIYQILGQSIEYEYDDDGEASSREEAHNLKGRIIRRKKCVRRIRKNFATSIEIIRNRM